MYTTDLPTMYGSAPSFFRQYYKTKLEILVTAKLATGQPLMALSVALGDPSSV